MPFKNPHPFYSVWQSMLERCRNTKSPSYHRYGGRGITVCDEWKTDFHRFVSDMGERPPKYTLDRINNNLGYSKDNCRWASRKEQSSNRECTVVYRVDGVDLLVADVARQLGMKGDSIKARIEKGLPLSEVMNPERKHCKKGLAVGGLANGARQRAKTHCPHGHEYNAENLIIRKEGWRECKACRRKATHRPKK